MQSSEDVSATDDVGSAESSQNEIAGDESINDVITPGDPPESEEESEGPDYSEDEDEDEDEDETDEVYLLAEEDTEDVADPRTRVLSVLELEALFMSCAPSLAGMFGIRVIYPRLIRLYI